VLFLPVTCKQRHGHHLAPPIPRSPLLPDVLRRCVAPPETSPSKELARSTSNRRRSRGYLAGNRAPLPSIPPRPKAKPGHRYPRAATYDSSAHPPRYLLPRAARWPEWTG
jgi:hypothetical protein